MSRLPPLSPRHDLQRFPLRMPGGSQQKGGKSGPGKSQATSISPLPQEAERERKLREDFNRATGSPLVPALLEELRERPQDTHIVHPTFLTTNRNSSSGSQFTSPAVWAESRVREIAFIAEKLPLPNILPAAMAVQTIAELGVAVPKFDYPLLTLASLLESAVFSDVQEDVLPVSQPQSHRERDQEATAQGTEGAGVSHINPVDGKGPRPLWLSQVSNCDLQDVAVRTAKAYGGPAGGGGPRSTKPPAPSHHPPASAVSASSPLSPSRGLASHPEREGRIFNADRQVGETERDGRRSTKSRGGRETQTSPRGNDSCAVPSRLLSRQAQRAVSVSPHLINRVPWFLLVRRQARALELLNKKCASLTVRAAYVTTVKALSRDVLLRVQEAHRFEIRRLLFYLWSAHAKDNVKHRSALENVSRAAAEALGVPFLRWRVYVEMTKGIRMRQHAELKTAEATTIQESLLSLQGMNSETEAKLESAAAEVTSLSVQLSAATTKALLLKNLLSSSCHLSVRTLCRGLLSPFFEEVARLAGLRDWSLDLRLHMQDFKKLLSVGEQNRMTSIAQLSLEGLCIRWLNLQLASVKAQAKTAFENDIPLQSSNPRAFHQSQMRYKILKDLPPIGNLGAGLSDGRALVAALSGLRDEREREGAGALLAGGGRGAGAELSLGDLLGLDDTDPLRRCETAVRLLGELVSGSTGAKGPMLLEAKELFEGDEKKISAALCALILSRPILPSFSMDALSEPQLEALFSAPEGAKMTSVGASQGTGEEQKGEGGEEGTDREDEEGASGGDGKKEKEGGNEPLSKSPVSAKSTQQTEGKDQLGESKKEEEGEGGGKAGKRNAADNLPLLSDPVATAIHAVRSLRERTALVLERRDSFPDFALLLRRGELLERLERLSVEDLILRWVNFHISSLASEVQSFSDDLRDGAALFLLLNVIAPETVPKEAGVPDARRRAELVVEAGRRVGSFSLLTPDAILEGQADLLAAFAASLFMARPALLVRPSSSLKSPLELLNTANATWHAHARQLSLREERKRRLEGGMSPASPRRITAVGVSSSPGAASGGRSGGAEEKQEEAARLRQEAEELRESESFVEYLDDLNRQLPRLEAAKREVQRGRKIAEALQHKLRSFQEEIFIGRAQGKPRMILDKQQLREIARFSSVAPGVLRAILAKGPRGERFDETRDKVDSLLREQFAFIRNVFVSYATRGENGAGDGEGHGEGEGGTEGMGVSSAGLVCLYSDCKLRSPSFTPVKVEAIFDEIEKGDIERRGEGGTEEKGSGGRGPGSDFPPALEGEGGPFLLGPSRFVEALLRIAAAFRSQKKKIVERLEELLETHMKPNLASKLAGTDVFRNEAYKTNVRQALRSHSGALRAVYRVYSQLDAMDTSGSMTVNVSEFVDLLCHSGCLSGSEKEREKTGQDPNGSSSSASVGAMGVPGLDVLVSSLREGDVRDVFHRIQMRALQAAEGDGGQSEAGGEGTKTEEVGLDDDDQLAFSEFLDGMVAVALFAIPSPFLASHDKLHIFLNTRLFPGLVSYWKQRHRLHPSVPFSDVKILLLKLGYAKENGDDIGDA